MPSADSSRLCTVYWSSNWFLFIVQGLALTCKVLNQGPPKWSISTPKIDGSTQRINVIMVHCTFSQMLDWVLHFFPPRTWEGRYCLVVLLFVILFVKVIFIKLFSCLEVDEQSETLSRGQWADEFGDPCPKPIGANSTCIPKPPAVPFGKEVDKDFFSLEASSNFECTGAFNGGMWYRHHHYSGYSAL